MTRAEFSLRERDRKRLIKDRLVRLAVSAGGVGVLAALVLIFVYLAMMVLPLFSDAKITPNALSKTVSTQQVIAAGIDDYGQHAYLISKQGQIDFWSLNDDRDTPVMSQTLTEPNRLFAQSVAAQGWYGFASPNGEIHLFKPQLATALNKDQRDFAPKVFA